MGHGRGLQARWLKRDESFQLTNAAARAQFTVDSREARYNGCNFGCSIRWFRAATKSSSRNSILIPPSARCSRRHGMIREKVRTICLDAGHGGAIPAIAGGRQEKDLTLRLASELRDQLQKAGFKVVFSRTSDRFIELSERADLARKRGADLFVSLHFNGTGGDRSAAQGSEVYAMTPAVGFHQRAGEGLVRALMRAIATTPRICCSRIKSRSRSCAG